MVITTKAIVFSSVKYGESDLIVTCFTEEAGLKSYMLRGILKSKKGKFKVSLFQLLTQLEMVAVHKDKGSLERIKEAKMAFPYTTLHTHVLKSAIVMFLAEMLKNSIKEEEVNKRLYSYIEQSLLWLDNSDTIANFHILFLLKLSMYLGFYPDASNIDEPYFNMVEGYFEKIDASTYSRNGPEISAFKQFFGINFDELDGLIITKTERSKVLQLVLDYYQIHLQGYKRPKSLLVLNQLFA